MAGTRRKKRTTRTAKVRTGQIKTKRTMKSKTPREIAIGAPDIVKRLQTDPVWKSESTLTANYKHIGFIDNPNRGFGRNQVAEVLKDKEEREEEGLETYSDDDELRAACSQVRKTGKARPPRLTPRQRKFVKTLIDKHGDDTERMSKDTKLNKMLHSAAALHRMVEAFNCWGEGSGVDFRVPRKGHGRCL